MKKYAAVLLLAACACLAGCAAPPAGAADGVRWSEDWVTVGNIIGVETPENMVPRENSDALGASGMYYATWSIGEAEPYTNADGEDAQLYDAQVYLLLAGYGAAGKAEDSAAEWLDMALQRYAVEDTAEETYNGQEFTIVTYTYASETNPYARGASAFGVYRNYAVSVELSCQEDFEGSAKDILAGFLANCHYAV